MTGIGLYGWMEREREMDVSLSMEYGVDGVYGWRIERVWNMEYGVWRVMMDDDDDNR